jgi:hypothetical protein
LTNSEKAERNNISLQQTDLDILNTVSFGLFFLLVSLCHN